jgi:hypothetical protein
MSNTMLRIVCAAFAGLLVGTNAMAADPPCDGQQRIYGLFITGSGNQHWPQTRDFHNLLVDSYAADAPDLYLLLALEKEPETSGGIADGKASRENIEAAFSKIAAGMDGDDLFLFFVEWHGQGYTGRAPDKKRNIAYHGFFGRPPLISGEDDEKDFKESELELSIFCARGGLLDGRDFHYGMGEWGVVWYPRSKISRVRVLSRFTDQYVEGVGKVSDSDVYLERFTDYTRGDKNKNGKIETELGEVWDPDGDGNDPWDRETGEFDEDDWGEIDEFEDDYRRNASIPGVKFTLWDAGFDNRVDMDINPGQELEVDGTDSDNDGCIDGFDLNDDGDMDDWVTINEAIQVHRGSMVDDDLAELLSSIQQGTKVFIINSCFGGGLVNDLSGDNTIIITGSREVCSASAGTMPKRLMQAFGEQADMADTDDDGRVTFLEAFNFACVRRNSKGAIVGSYPFQYDDNGDGVSQEGLLPRGGDGELGNRIGLKRAEPPPAEDDAKR